MAKRRRKGLEKHIAQERIATLFQRAEGEARGGNLHRADRYVELARRLGMRYNVGIPRPLRRRFCKGCHGYLLPGRTSTVRVHRGRVIVHCLRCGDIHRIPHARETKARRTAPPPHAEP